MQLLAIGLRILELKTSILLCAKRILLSWVKCPPQRPTITARSSRSFTSLMKGRRFFLMISSVNSMSGPLSCSSTTRKWNTEEIISMLRFPKELTVKSLVSDRSLTDLKTFKLFSFLVCKLPCSWSNLVASSLTATLIFLVISPCNILFFCPEFLFGLLLSFRASTSLYDFALVCSPPSAAGGNLSVGRFTCFIFYAIILLNLDGIST